MLYILWFLSVVAVFLLGYKLGDITKHIKTVEEAVKQKVDRPAEVPASEVIDPYDEVQTAMYEHDKLMERLNPK